MVFLNQRNHDFKPYMQLHKIAILCTTSKGSDTLGKVCAMANQNKEAHMFSSNELPFARPLCGACGTKNLNKRI